jgi:hypothetical protein
LEVHGDQFDRMSALVAFSRLVLGTKIIVLETDPIGVEKAEKERGGAEIGLIGSQGSVLRGECCQVEGGSWVGVRNTGKEQLTEPWVHMVFLEEYAEGKDELGVNGASVGVWAAQKMGFIFEETPALRGAGRRRRQMHMMLARLQGEYIVQPFDKEEAVGKAGFLVSDGIENRPIDLMEFGICPVMNAAEVLELGAVVGVG